MGSSLTIKKFTKEEFKALSKDGRAIDVADSSSGETVIELYKHRDLMSCFLATLKNCDEYQYVSFTPEELVKVIALVKNGTDWSWPEVQESDMHLLIDLLNDTDFTKSVLTFNFDV